MKRVVRTRREVRLTVTIASKKKSLKTRVVMVMVMVREAMIINVSKETSLKGGCFHRHFTI